MKTSKVKKLGLFRLRFEDGSCVFVTSCHGWSGLIPLVKNIAPTNYDKIYISQVSWLDYFTSMIIGE